MLFGSNGSPNKSSAQKRLREPTGSSGPEYDSSTTNEARASAEMTLWQPNALPPTPPHNGGSEPKHDSNDQDRTGGAPPSEFPALSASYGSEANPVRKGNQVPPRASPAFPSPTSPLFDQSQQRQQTQPSSAASAPPSYLNGEMDPRPSTEQSFVSLSIRQQHEQGSSSVLQTPHLVDAHHDTRPKSSQSPFRKTAALAGNGVSSATTSHASVSANARQYSPNTSRSSLRGGSTGRRASPSFSNSGSKALETLSSSRSPSSSSSDDDDDDEEDDESDTNEHSERGMREDRVKRYPRFTTEYAEKCKHDLVPFIREHIISIPPSLKHVHSDPAAAPGGATRQQQQQQQQRQFAPRFVLYGKYVYQRTLGKGTYSKVVLAEELDCSPVVQQQQLISGGDGINSPVSNGLSPAASVGGGAGGPLVALKIFRDSDVYREACWDEYNILNALCSPVYPGHTGDASSGQHPSGSVPRPLTTVRTATTHPGLMGYYSSVGRFMVPLDYLPHPLHPVVVYPVMGPSLLHVVRHIKKASRDRCVAAKRSSSTNASPVSPDTRRAKDFAGSEEGVRATGEQQPLHGKRRIWFRGLPLSILKVALHQILLFLKFTHDRGLVHTDLKPENILFETSLSLPTPVNIFYKCQDRRSRNGNGVEGSYASLVGASLEARKTINDEYKLASATSKVKHMAGQFPSEPSESGATERSPSGLPNGHHRVSDGGAAELHHAHTVTVDMPLLNGIRVVDLGTAQFLSAFTHKSHIDGVTPVSYDPIQTSHYRSPETLMGTGWNASADTFSLGCMIPELLTGDCLFMPQDTLEHLALMRHVIGPFWSGDGGSGNGCSSSSGNGNGNGNGGSRDVERVFSLNARTFNHYFDPETGKLKWPVTEEIFKDYERQQARNEENGFQDDDQEPPLDPLKLTTKDDEAFVVEKPTLQEILGSHPLLFDLCQRMLRYNPLERITAAEALCHPFFQS